jgi:hypothetical protein
MGNCHFKTEFETENVTGKFSKQKLNFEFTYFSPNKDEFYLSILHREGWVWKSLESRKKEVKITICNERDVKS